VVDPRRTGTAGHHQVEVSQVDPIGGGVPVMTVDSFAFLSEKRHGILNEGGWGDSPNIPGGSP
jgi:hypothetical protein